MNEIRFQLIKEATREYIRRGIPPTMAARKAAQDVNLIISRYEAGWDEEMLFVGMDGFFKKLVKAVSKPFKKIGKTVEKGVKQFAKQVEKHVIRPVAHWKYLSVVANVIPVVGTALSLAISAAQTARSLYVAKKDARKANVDFEQNATIAYSQYKQEIMKRNIQPLSYDQFKQMIVSQSSF
jgi:hypothetical protein